MKLINILKRNFILPLTLLLIFASLIATLINIFYNSKYSRKDFLQKVKKGKDKSVSFILTLIQELLYERFQLVFDYLIIAREVLDKYHLNFDPQELKNMEYFTNYMVNLISLYASEKFEDLEENKMIWFINNETTDENFFHGIEFDNIFENQKKKYLQLKYLYLFSKLIPILKGFYNNFKGKESFCIDSFYMMNRKTELFIMYPIKEYSTYKQIYDFDTFTKNNRNCKNKDRNVPNYFYIFCRESFVNIENIYKKNPNRRMFITYPYQNMNKNEQNSINVVGICYIFNFTNNNDIIENDLYKKTLNDEIVVCADVVINSYIDILDEFQNQLFGYFYIIITNKEYPMYFPGMNDDPYFNDITRFEYNFSYFTFSILNVTNFNSITLPKLIKEYNPDTDIYIPNRNEIETDENNSYYTVKMEKDENTFQKGEEVYRYYIYPLFYDNYHLNSDINKLNEKNKEHVLSIIYVVNDKNMSEQFISLYPYIKFLSILYCFTFLVIGTIILNCAYYGIFIISNNITKPIKDIKTRLKAGLSKKNIYLKGLKDENEFTYEGININKLISLGLIGKKTKILNKKMEQDNNDEINMDFDRNSNDLFGRYILGNENLLKGNNTNAEDDEVEENQKFLNTDENIINEEEEEDEEDDEADDDTDDIPLVKNSEINNQFNLLLDLKKVILFMRGPQVNFKGTNIIKFISCDKVFNEIKNKLGENVCLSNMGNLENLKKRYDKSIIFLTKSLDLDKDNQYLVTKDILSIVDNIFETDKFKMRGFEDNKIKDIKDNFNSINAKPTLKEDSLKESIHNKNDIDSNINNIEFIRFMKLFYAYKMYFSNVKKIEKILNKTLHMTKTKDNNGEENFEKSDIYKYIKSILLYFNDYFISNSVHIHKKYKSAIYICLQRLIESKDITRKKEKIIYCYTELFAYYISYLKIKIKRTINEINENNNENDFSPIGKEHKEYEKLKQLKTNRKANNEKCFNKIVNIANKLKEYIKKMNSKIDSKQTNLSISDGEKNKYKEFLNELKTVDQKSYNIQFNIFLIEQRYNYLFAKFSKLCGDYAMAITYYLKVNDERRLISNGLLYIKANKKILNIINFAINNSQFLSIQEKDDKIMREILEKCNKELEQRKKNNYKDLIIILDKNYSSNDSEKVYRLQIQQYKAIKIIFENFMSLNDRFALYIFGNVDNYENKDKDNEDVYINYIKNNSIKKLISLTYKNNKNYSFINGIIDKFHDDIINNYNNQTKIRQMYLNLSRDELNKSSYNLENSFLKNKTKNKYNNSDIYKMKIKYTINAIFKVINDFNIHDEERKKYIILISESFKNEQTNETNYNVKDLFKDINDGYKIKIERLFIIGTLLEEQNKFNLISNELLNYGIKNEYLEFENIQEMNKKFLTLGTLPRKYEYQNEKLNK